MEVCPSIFLNLARTPLASSSRYLFLFHLFHTDPPTKPLLLFAAKLCTCPHWFHERSLSIVYLSGTELAGEAHNEVDTFADFAYGSGETKV